MQESTVSQVMYSSIGAAHGAKRVGNKQFRATSSNMSQSQAKFNTHQHPNFGRGKHKVHSDAVNHELRRKLWDGQLPVKINLHYQEVSMSKQPRSIYMMLPRMNYFTFCLEKVKQFFDDYVAVDSSDSQFSEMWFEYNGTAMRWDLPIGV
mmetsp:Transcript_12985/g.21954  ORF Transcript_12985/g.21954 Transcript_12985/m.21954 type:complete len:150 (+) Transcript_12985:173-622(+)